jgi:hypothetical protein
MAPWHQVAREAFQEELEELEAGGWFTFEGTDPAELGREAARWVMGVESGASERADVGRKQAKAGGVVPLGEL